jgi:hypothetical protein
MVLRGETGVIEKNVEAHEMQKMLEMLEKIRIDKDNS